MTTVINLNILNFFGSGADKPAEKEVDTDAGYSERREDHSRWRDRVIDVTPYARATDDKEERSRGLACHAPALRGPRSARAIAAHSVVNKTYDRKGKVVPCFLPKGMNIDSYV